MRLITYVTMCAVVFQMQPDGHEANHVTMIVCCDILDAARWTLG